MKCSWIRDPDESNLIRKLPFLDMGRVLVERGMSFRKVQKRKPKNVKFAQLFSSESSIAKVDPFFQHSLGKKKWKEWGEMG
jgi:hypothetical protein